MGSGATRIRTYDRGGSRRPCRWRLRIGQVATERRNVAGELLVRSVDVQRLARLEVEGDVTGVEKDVARARHLDVVDSPYDPHRVRCVDEDLRAEVARERLAVRGERRNSVPLNREPRRGELEGRVALLVVLRDRDPGTRRRVFEGEAVEGRVLRGRRGARRPGHG